MWIQINNKNTVFQQELFLFCAKLTLKLQKSDYTSFQKKKKNPEWNFERSHILYSKKISSKGTKGQIFKREKNIKHMDFN